jgi:hypothetical protein
VFTKISSRKGHWSRHSFAMIRLDKTLVCPDQDTTLVYKAYTTFGTYQKAVRGYPCSGRGRLISAGKPGFGTLRPI